MGLANLAEIFATAMLLVLNETGIPADAVKQVIVPLVNVALVSIAGTFVDRVGVESQMGVLVRVTPAT